MINPIELSLLIQTTIYFTVVSSIDGFLWTCNQDDFFKDVCETVTWTSPSSNFEIGYYYYCKKGAAIPKQITYKDDSFICGSVRADVVVTETSSCSGAGSYQGQTASGIDLCVVGTLQSSTSPDQFTIKYLGEDECGANFKYVSIFLLVVLIAWLIRIMIQGTWSYISFFKEAGAEKRRTGNINEDEVGDVYGRVTSQWNFHAKYFFFGIDVLCAVGLLIVMILYATTPYSFCSQPSLYTCIALAALSLANLVTVIPYIVFWRYIDTRILRPLSSSLAMKPRTTEHEN